MFNRIKSRQLGCGRLGNFFTIYTSTRYSLASSSQSPMMIIDNAGLILKNLTLDASLLALQGLRENTGDSSSSCTAKSMPDSK